MFPENRVLDIYPKLNDFLGKLGAAGIQLYQKSTKDISQGFSQKI